MFSLKVRTRKRASAGTLGAVIRSTGYLQGGYRGSTINSTIQMYNTNTEVGAIVYDTGYQRYYTPGIPGNLSGYFSINALTNFQKFNYASATVAASFTIPTNPRSSTCDYGLNTAAWVWCSTDASGTYGTLIDSIYKVNTTTESPINRGSLAPAATGTSRQGLSVLQCSSVDEWSSGTLHTIDHTTEACTISASHANLVGGVIQIPVGLTKNNNTGFYIGMNQCNVKVTYSGNTVLSLAQSTGFTYHFGESHAVNSDVSGYVMAGYSDTTGRYGGAQHGLCQKLIFATESIGTLADLVVAQSSGQMLPGF